ncbi:MAG: energy transducer TonB [Candidatus Methylacidiphilaceae bacterium]
MTTLLLEPQTRTFEAKTGGEGKPKAVDSDGWGIWPSIVLALLFHAGVAALVLPGVPGSPLPAIAPLPARFTSNSTSVELIDEIPALPSTAAPTPEEQKVTEPAVLQAPAAAPPSKPLVAQQPSPRPAARPAHPRGNRLPALGGGLVLSEPPYPYEARRQRMQGKVTLQVFVREGRVIWVEVLGSSGHNLLDGSARQWALHRWRFPGVAAGSFTEAVLFSLEGT